MHNWLPATTLLLTLSLVHGGKAGILNESSSLSFACDWLTLLLSHPLPTPHLRHAVTSETPVIVQCTQPATGWTAPGESSFIVTLGTSTATQGVPGCGDTKSTPVTVQASVKPVVKVTLDSSPNVCSESPTSTSDWTVFSDIAASLNVFLEVTNSVECKLQDSNGADITGGLVCVALNPVLLGQGAAAHGRGMGLCMR